MSKIPTTQEGGTVSGDDPNDGLAMKRRPFLGPLTLPADAFEELEPTIRPCDGKLLKRYKLKGTELILQQDPMDQLIYVDEVKVQPMPMPTARVFYKEYVYGRPEPQGGKSE